MRISQQTAIVMIACSLSGLLLATLVGAELRRRELLSRQHSLNVATLHQVSYLEASVDRWLETVGLVLAGEHAVATDSVRSQAEHVKHILRDIEGSSLLEGVGDAFGSLQEAIDQIDQIDQSVEELVELEGHQRAIHLTAISTEVGDVSEWLSVFVEGLFHVIEDQSEQAGEAVAIGRRRFIAVVAAVGAMYVVAIASIWHWASVNMVRPLVRLTAAAKEADDTADSFQIDDVGPLEIKQLANDIRTLVASLQASKWLSEDAVRKSRELADRANAITATAADGIFTIDERGKVLSFNRAAQDIFKYEIHHIVGRHVSLLVPGYFGDCDRQNINACPPLDPHQVTGSGREVMGKRHNGMNVAVELSVSVLERNDNRTFTAIARDITRRKEAEAKVQKLNEQLVATSRHAGMAEIASGVLHNIGNVLTIVNVSATEALNKVRGGRAAGLGKSMALIKQHADDLGGFFTDDTRGQQLPAYLTKLSAKLEQDQSDLTDDLEALLKHVEHVKEIVSLQQAYARGSSAVQTVRLEDVVEDAMSMNADRLSKYGVNATRDYGDVPAVALDKHKVLQILVNLIRNAGDAMADNNGTPRHLSLAIRKSQDNTAQILVTDTGIGISQENMTRVFQHGFTTKKDGHGFGLHSSANTAREIGGRLDVDSAGQGLGATFCLSLPLKPQESSS